MSTLDVRIHPGCFPPTARAALLEALRTRRVPGSLHYRTTAQTERWLAVHARYAPSRSSRECEAAYAAAFGQAAERVGRSRIGTPVVLGLGCGGGLKDTRLLQALSADGGRVLYVPTDVGVPMTIVASQTAAAGVPGVVCRPLVVDLLQAEDLGEVVDALAGDGPRVVTFFGMIMNLEPAVILPRLAGWIRRGDVLLLSANLAPGADYPAGVEAVLPQYDNLETRLWLELFLRDVGLDPAGGTMQFGVEPCPAGTGLLRIGVWWELTQFQEIALGGERFRYEPGDRLELFFSYRYTPDRVRALLAAQGLGVRAAWTAGEEQEGVFLCRRSGSTPDEAADDH